MSALLEPLSYKPINALQTDTEPLSKLHSLWLVLVSGLGIYPLCV